LRLANNKANRLEKEIADLKTELEIARSQKKDAEARLLFQNKLWAEKEKLTKKEADARAAADAEKIEKLEADLSAARERAVEDFLASQDFVDRQLDFASLWVLDTVGQCRRLCKEKLGAGDYTFLVPSEIAREVEARRKEGAEIVLESGGSSEEEGEPPEVAEEPSSAIPASDPPAGPAA
jgi:chromosome segregation ATPase